MKAFIGSNLSITADSIAEKIAQAEEAEICKQLGKLITEGILVIHSTKPTLVREHDGTIRVMGAVYLESAHERVISQKNQEIEELKKMVKALNEMFIN